MEIIWDQEDSRLFGVSTEYAKDLVEENHEKIILENSQKNSEKKEWIGSEFFIFFYNMEFGINKQESHIIKRDITKSICVEYSFYLFYFK